MKRAPWVMLATLCLFGCKDEELDASDKAEHGEACEPAQAGEETTSCVDGLSCEPSGEPGSATYICAAPLEIRGFIYDAFSEEPIEGALVAALDEAGSPVTDVAVTDAEGRYVLAVSARRDATAEIAEALKWTLFVSASDYLPFPAGIRPAIPINAADAVTEEDDEDEDKILSVIDNVSTAVALLPLEDAEKGGVTISGTVNGEHPEGTLVVAEGGATAPYTLADASGKYTLFNVPTGGVTIRGYRRGLHLEEVSRDFTEDSEAVDLAVVTEDEAELTELHGSVNIVNAEGGSQTSVVLVPVSLYNDVLERGPVPFGLRAPDPPRAPDVASAFAILGVPPGTYKVLAAFENDDLVRDPDDSIAGTAIQEITVGDAPRQDIEASFKVTQDIAVIGPGADIPEYVADNPTFIWADDSSETHYALVVFDALGNLVWENPEVVGVSGSDRVEVAYEGPALEEGMYYQFRATSYKETPQGTFAISRTEDLRGVFVFGSPPAEME